MANTRNNQAQAQQAQAQRPDDVTLTRKLIKVTKGNKFGKVRLIFKVDGEPFAGFDENGVATTRNDFSIDCYAALNQLAPLNGDIATADAILMGARPKPQLFSLALWDCEITFTRHYVFEGEQRETGNPTDVYQRDAWKTTITAVTPSNKAMPRRMANMLDEVIADPEDKSNSAPALNGFNVG